MNAMDGIGVAQAFVGVGANLGDRGATIRMAIDRLRHQRRRIQAGAPLEAADTLAVTSNGASRDQSGELHDLLKQLPEAQRLAIELSYFQGYTHEEIARKLNLPVGTVKSRILLGLRKLHAMLK